MLTLLCATCRRQAPAMGAILVATVFAAAAPAADSLVDRLTAEDRERLAADVERSGDAARGAVLFHAAHLACTKCHGAGGQQPALGPALAAMPPGVTPAAVVPYLVEAVLEPSAVVRPEYRGVTIVTDEGSSHAGVVVREDAEAVVLRDAAADGREVTIPAAAIEERVESAVSLMPAGLADQLPDRQAFLDLVRYLVEIARGGPERARALEPDPAVLAAQAPQLEHDIDHAGFIAEWADARQARDALRRGKAIYTRVCANCHGTLDAPGSLPTAPRFAEARFKAGADPFAMYRTLTTGTGLMAAQTWMVPAQKYDVIHYIREKFLKQHNPSAYVAITPEYLRSLPAGTSRGPEPSTVEPWRMHDYGPFLAGTFEVGGARPDIVRKGLAVRLDPGPGGVAAGRAWVLYDLETLRAAAVWTGTAFVDWAGINFDGRHSAHPRTVGDVALVAPQQPGWADPVTGSFADPRPVGRDGRPYGPLPRSYGRFRAVHHAGDVIVLDYEVGGTRILETATLAGDAAAGAGVVRSFSIGPRRQPLRLRLAAEPATATFVGGPPADGVARLVTADGGVECEIAAGAPRLDLAFLVAPPASAGVAAAVLPAVPADLVGQPARPLWAQALETRAERGRDDEPVAVDALSPPAVNPWQAQLRFSGLDFTGPDAAMAILATWDGDVWSVTGIESPAGTLTWRRIASGLFQPLGLRVVDGVIHVGCRDRIVRLVDLDGDGQTDRYDTFNDDHQVTEHFHEFAMGLETDAAGNFYYAKSARHALPAVVPQHGTLLRVARDGSATDILATGFRAANGVCVEPDGTFWVTDQEGHWCPKNRINHVRPGGFYGNMLAWHDVTDEADEAMREPAVWITNAFDRSPAELLRVTSDRWPPLAGRLLELSYGEGRVHLVLPEPARDGSMLQGCMVPLPLPDLPTGVVRGRFHPRDGQLYTCGLYAWAGNRTAPGGFFRIRRTDRPLRIPIDLHAAAGRLVATFAEPLDRAVAADPAAWRVTTWGIRRTAKYGSPHVDERPREVAAVVVSADGRTAELDVPDLAATRCYELEWNVQGADGEPVRGRLHGTIH
jgi:putative heme-binding domain-containing protein